MSPAYGDFSQYCCDSIALARRLRDGRVGSPALFALAAHPHRSAPTHPGCKRLHLTFSPSWAARWSGRLKTQIVGSTGGSGGPTRPWSCPTLPGYKRLHLTFGPSWAARWSGRPKSRIVSRARVRGCVRRACSSRPRAHRRRPRPTAWVSGCESGGLRCRQLKPACARPSSAARSRLPHLRSPRVPLLTFAPNPAHPGCTH